jgi:NTE family protein
LVRLPWDYRRVYGLEPDEQLVADAVRASMAIPFFFRPATLTAASGLTSTLVDGGILSNFPIDSLDRFDGRKPRWPSFGITVLPNLPEGNDKVIPALAPLRMLGAPHLLEGVITTALVGRDQAYLNEPWVSARTIRVNSTDVGFLDFDISDNETEALYTKGYAAAEKFLSTWDWDAYVERFR